MEVRSNTAISFAMYVFLALTSFTEKFVYTCQILLKSKNSNGYLP